MFSCRLVFVINAQHVKELRIITSQHNVWKRTQVKPLRRRVDFISPKEELSLNIVELSSLSTTPFLTPSKQILIHGNLAKY